MTINAEWASEAIVVIAASRPALNQLMQEQCVSNSFAWNPCLFEIQ